MILHLITDDKFADYAINQFKEIDNTSRFVLVKPTEATTLSYLKGIENVQQLVLNSFEYKEFLKNLHEFSGLIIHGFFYAWQEEFVLSAPYDLKVAWVCWGGEIYGRNEFESGFLAPKTKLLHRIKQLKRILKGRSFRNPEFLVELKSFNRINFCLTDMVQEYEFAKRVTNSTMRYLWYNYYSIEETVGVLQNKIIQGNNILVGNSCTLTNNHLDAFHLLGQFDLEDRKIIVPLSYGENWLQKKIIQQGIKVFRDNFEPLIDFLERDTYNQYICSASIMIMNHYRPQAQGNIITGLWLGAKVYLSNKSMTYSHFKEMDAIVFSIEDELKSTNPTALTPLSNEDREHNRKILMQEYGKENMKSRIQEIINALNK